MRLIRIFTVLILLAVVCAVGCTKSSPIDPGGGGGGGGGPDTLVVAAQMQLNYGSGFSANEQIPVSLVAEGADSVAVFNRDASGVSGLRWYDMSGGTLLITDWMLPGGEGPKDVGAVFRKAGLADSDTVVANIVLDQSPPHVLPGLVFPAAGASGVPSISAFRWLPAADAYCPPEHLTYRLALGTSATALVDKWSGGRTSTVLQGLGTLESWYWQLTVEDAAGNVAVGEVAQFSTWDLVLPEFGLVNAGTFMMGSPDNEAGRGWSEMQHRVTLTNNFFMGRTNVTIGQFVQMANWALETGRATIDAGGVHDSVSGELIVGFSEFSIYEPRAGGRLGSNVDPARISDHITWWGAAAFCDWLNERAGLPGLYDRADGWRCNGGDLYGSLGFRLPAEAEWEYTCRAGTTTEFANGRMGGDDCWDQNLDQIGWYCGNYMLYGLLPARKIPNGWGFYDMQGGLSDWCYDKWAPFTAADQVNPVVDMTETGRIVRGTGGTYPGYSRECRSAARAGWSENVDNQHCSIRLAFGTGGGG